MSKPASCLVMVTSFPSMSFEVMAPALVFQARTFMSAKIKGAPRPCNQSRLPFHTSQAKTAWTTRSDPAIMAAAISGTPKPLQSVANRSGLLGVHQVMLGACEAHWRSHPMMVEPTRTARTALTARTCQALLLMVSRNIGHPLFPRHLS